MAPSFLHTLALMCLWVLSVSSIDRDSQVAVVASVGQNVTIHCRPPNMTQDGVYMYKQLFEKQTLTYFYKDGTFSPKGPFKNRLGTNKLLQDFTVSIINVTVWDSGVYWCVFNKRDRNVNSTHKTLLVVSGKQTDCLDVNTENTYMLLIIVCVAATFIMLLITVILLWAIPKIKHCCERGKYAPHHPPGDGVYEDMRGRQTPAQNTLINPAYQTCTHTRSHSTKTNN